MKLETSNLQRNIKLVIWFSLRIINYPKKKKNTHEIFFEMVFKLRVLFKPKTILVDF